MVKAGLAFGLALSGLLAPWPTAAAEAEPPAAPPEERPASAPLRAEPPPPAASAAAPPAPRWMSVPRLVGRLDAGDIGLVINTADPYSVEVGEYYALRRGLKPEQVLRVELPVKARLNPQEFYDLRRRIDVAFGEEIQAIAFAWVMPFAVECASLPGALALGLDPTLCVNGCRVTRASTYFNSPVLRPWQDLHLRPSMLIAARTVAQGKALIDRGVAADRSLGRRGQPPARAVLLETDDALRSVRARYFPPPGWLRPFNVQVQVEKAPAIKDRDRLILHLTGRGNVPDLDTLRWLDGALADHMTSYGGVLDATSGQMTALAWIESGATASYGTVSEPCNHPQKFPHPQVLLMHYLQGATAIEAYWRSVAWPHQGVFIGEPLAAPFAR
jgi:uncharacterized protein (TIGR03790 family)